MKDESPESDARTRILDAAEEAFAAAGLAGARVAAIVDAAGVNKATLYYYFDSKQALYEAVLSRVFDQLRALAGEVPRQPHPNEAEALVTFVEGYLEVVRQHPRVVKMMLRGLLDAPEDVVAFLGPRVHQVLPVLGGAVAKGQAEGRLNPALVPMLVPPTLLAPVVFHIVTAPVFESITGIPGDDLRALWMRNLRAQSLHGLIARAASPEGDADPEAS